MQWLRSAFQLPAHTLQQCLSARLDAAKPTLSIRPLASQASVSQQPRILVKPLKHASLEPSAAAFFIPDKGDPYHTSQDFTMILKKYPRHLVDKKGCVVDSLLLPHWLPMPPHPATHQRRHLSLSMPSTQSASKEVAAVDEQDVDGRWEPIPVTPDAIKVDAARPILRVFVMATKKRVHKRAVLRHRVRTRLIAALRNAVFRLQDEKLDVARMIDLQRNVVMLIAHPTAYSRKMDELVDDMEKGIRRVARSHGITSPHSSKPSRKHYDDKGESKGPVSTRRSQPRKQQTA